MGDVLIGEITEHTLLRIIKIEPQKTKRYPRQILKDCRGCFLFIFTFIVRFDFILRIGHFLIYELAYIISPISVF